MLSTSGRVVLLDFCELLISLPDAQISGVLSELLAEYGWPRFPTDSVQKLYESWEEDPDVLHGVFGRKPKPDGSYSKSVRESGYAPVVLTRVLLTRREHAAQFFIDARRFEEIQTESEPFGNGEDIIFSYSVMRASGRPNRIHDVCVNELPDHYAIHRRNRPTHTAHRTRLLRACQAWLEESNHETGCDLHYV